MSKSRDPVQTKENQKVTTTFTLCDLISLSTDPEGSCSAAPHQNTKANHPLLTTILWKDVFRAITHLAISGNVLLMLFRVFFIMEEFWRRKKGRRILLILTLCRKQQFRHWVPARLAAQILWMQVCQKAIDTHTDKLNSGTEEVSSALLSSQNTKNDSIPH